ncbi:CBS domain-containing protein [Halorubrum sp. Eb13]|uniref:CBS domain-containing protein n=1 Tax=Halorubrum sp. Eb13 TaxID=1383843 RepID=UPI000B98DC21|nr:CBS domain-containing protein [Halorubrum sp. Eb13]OYR49289.1 signal transduction protein [Halorubrum sp. Eb13]
METESTPVSELMSTGLLTTTLDTAVEHAAETLLTEGVGSLVVLDESGGLAGVLTTTDLAEVVSSGRVPGSATVVDYMTDDVTTVASTDAVYDAAVKMIRGDIQHLPVTDGDDEVVGMLSATDLTAQLTYMTSSGTD